MKQRRLLRPVFCLLLVLILLCTPACKAPATQNGTTGNTESSGGAQITDGFVPVLRFVVTSDVHIRGENNNLQSYELLASFISTAYGYSDAHPHYQKLDGMFFVGDVTNSGTKAQLSYFFNYVKENVREGTVARAVMGNHEYYASGNFNATSMKEAPEDFTLWKAQKPGEPAWDSPWGKGRPGWHIECSAMSMKYLGETFDIHCGGKDLLFPHHENEIAQSEGATGHPYVHYWMHNGFINVDNQKMSKSLNNFFTVRDISKSFDLEAVRMFMLSAHYRSPINFSREQIEAASTSLNRLYTARDQLRFLQEHCEEKPLTPEEEAFLERVKGYENRFDQAMDDDLNTADALGAVFELVKDANVTLTEQSAREAVTRTLESLKAICGVLGILTREEEAIPAEIQQMIDERAEARKNKNWARSDELRNAIQAAGYILEDTKQGQKVRRDV